MFGFHDDLHFISENDFEILQSDQNYISTRKGSFIDLLSYGKVPDCLAEDLLNLESFSNDYSLLEVHKTMTESEPIQLLLDEFPDINSLQKGQTLADCQYKTYIATLNKKYTNDYIGTLTAEERKRKIERYLEKKKRRTWKKKIHYDCRKKVADNRLREKGRFVTRNKDVIELSKKETKIT